VPYVCEGATPLAEYAEDATVTLENVKIESRKAGPTAVLSGVTAADSVGAARTTADDQTGLDTATDGGDAAETDEPRTEKQRFATAYTRAETDDSEFVEYDDLFPELTEFYDEGRAERLIEKAKTRRKPAWIIARADRTFERGDLPE